MLEEKLLALKEKFQFPGLTAAYILPDGTNASLAIGFADKEQTLPMKASDRMLAASTGKTMVATIILLLVSEGKLSLEDLAITHLGKYDWFHKLPNASEFTIRHLLSHTAGLPNHVLHPKFPAILEHDQEVQNLPAFVLQCIFNAESPYLPGKGWQYTDSGYIVLGAIIEEILKQPYYDVLTKRILVPYALNATEPSNKKKIRGLIPGYTDKDNYLKRPEKSLDESGALLWNPYFEWTGGGIVSTSSDLAKWAQLLYSGKVLPEKQLTQMLSGTPFGAPERKTKYGLGVIIEDTPHFGPQYGHLGMIPGYATSMKYLPDYNVSFAFQINSDIGVSDRSTSLMAEVDTCISEDLVS